MPIRKTKTYKPKTISEAIDNLQEFLESDLYSKFRPEQKLPTGKGGKLKSWYREDVFADEKEFIKYLQDHFNILRKEISALNKKPKVKVITIPVQANEFIGTKGWRAAHKILKDNKLTKGTIK